MEKKMLSKTITAPAEISRYEVLEYYKDRLIARNTNSKVGVINAYDSVLVPFEYGNIYFHNADDYWVNNNGYWAMMDHEGELKTGYEFLNIEELNSVFFTNMLYATKMDTSNGFLLYESREKRFSDKTNSLKKIARLVLENMDRRITFSALFSNGGSAEFSFAKKADGYHVIYINEVYPEAWSQIYFLPDQVSNYMTAFQKGDKFGLEKGEIKYDGIVFDITSELSYDSEVLYVKDGMMYKRVIERVATSAKDKNSHWEKAGRYDEYHLR
jgi:hypothetical protein